MRICVDIDGVLADFVNSFLETLNEIRRRRFWGLPRRVRYEDVHRYDLADATGSSPPVIADLVNSFGMQGRYLTLTALPDAPGVMRTLSKAHELTVVTERPARFSQDSIAWLAAHSIPYRRLVHCTPAERPHLASQHDLLIEDRLEYARDAAEAGCNVILFDHPWNREGALPPRVFRVASWQEALRVVQALEEADRAAGKRRRRATDADQDRPLLQSVNERWKEGLRVQMHFNEIIIRNRTMAFTIGSGLIAAAMGLRTVNALWLPLVGLAALVFLYVAYLLDRGYYFPMLLGAVKYTSELDRTYDKLSGPEYLKLYGLTDSITDTVSPGGQGSHRHAAKLVGLCYVAPLVLCLALLTWWAIQSGLLDRLWAAVFVLVLSTVGTLVAGKYIHTPAAPENRLYRWGAPILVAFAVFLASYLPALCFAGYGTRPWYTKAVCARLAEAVDPFGPQYRGLIRTWPGALNEPPWPGRYTAPALPALAAGTVVNTARSEKRAAAHASLCDQEGLVLSRASIPLVLHPGEARRFVVRSQLTLTPALLRRASLALLGLGPPIRARWRAHAQEPG